MLKIPLFIIKQNGINQKFQDLACKSWVAYYVYSFVGMDALKPSIQSNWHFLLLKNKPWIAHKNDKVVKIIIKTQILSWKTIRVSIMFILFWFRPPLTGDEKMWVGNVRWTTPQTPSNRSKVCDNKTSWKIIESTIKVYGEISLHKITKICKRDHSWNPPPPY